MSENNNAKFALLGAVLGPPLLKIIPKPYSSIILIILFLTIALFILKYSEKTKMPFRIILFAMTFPVSLIGIIQLAEYFYPKSFNYDFAITIILIIYGAIALLGIPFVNIKYGDEKQVKNGKIYAISMTVIVIFVFFVIQLTKP